MYRNILSHFLALCALCSCQSVNAGVFSRSDELTDADRPAIKKLFKEELPQAFATLAMSQDKFASLLADDVKLRWIVQEADGREAFLNTIGDGFREDARLFAVAVGNYKFVLQNCQTDSKKYRPIGLPGSVDITTFDPGTVTPDDLAKHPGLMMPEVKPISEIFGKDNSVNRYLMIASFRHTWMTQNDPAYVYVDRYIVGKRAGELKIAEYEFTANLEDMTTRPTPLTECPE